MLFQLQEWDYCRVKDIMKLLFRSHAPSRHHGFIYEVPVAWTCSGFDNEAGHPGHRYAASRSGRRWDSEACTPSSFRASVTVAQSSWSHNRISS